MISVWTVLDYMFVLIQLDFLMNSTWSPVRINYTLLTFELYLVTCLYRLHLTFLWTVLDYMVVLIPLDFLMNSTWLSVHTNSTWLSFELYLIICLYWFHLTFSDELYLIICSYQFHFTILWTVPYNLFALISLDFLLNSTWLPVRTDPSWCSLELYMISFPYSFLGMTYSHCWRPYSN